MHLTMNLLVAGVSGKSAYSQLGIVTILFVRVAIRSHRWLLWSCNFSRHLRSLASYYVCTIQINRVVKIIWHVRLRTRARFNERATRIRVYNTVLILFRRRNRATQPQPQHTTFLVIIWTLLMKFWYKVFYKRGRQRTRIKTDDSQDRIWLHL